MPWFGLPWAAQEPRRFTVKLKWTAPPTPQPAGMADASSPTRGSKRTRNAGQSSALFSTESSDEDVPTASADGDVDLSQSRAAGGAPLDGAAPPAPKRPRSQGTLAAFFQPRKAASAPAQRQFTSTAAAAVAAASPAPAKRKVRQAAPAAPQAAAAAGIESAGSDDDDEEDDETPVTAAVDSAPQVSDTVSGPVLGEYHPLEAVQDLWKPGEPVPFRALTRVLREVEGITGRHAIQELVRNFFRSVIACSPQDLLPAVYMCSSKLAPEVDGIELGIGESILTKAICQATGRQLKDVKAALKEAGDLGKVAEASRSKQATLGFVAAPKPLLLRDVFATFRDIATKSGKASQDAKISLIKRLLVKASGQDAEPRYIIRGLQGKYRIGLAAKSVQTALAQAVTITPPAAGCEGEGGSFARRLDTRVSPSGKARPAEAVDAELAAADETLKQVFSELPSYDLIVPALLRGGVAAAREACSLTPGMPVTPMLAKPTKGVSEVCTRLEGVAFTSEWKYDGERAQVHKIPPRAQGEGGVTAAAAASGGSAHMGEARGQGHRIFSRNHEETTGKYPDLAAILASAEHAAGDNWRPYPDSAVVGSEPGDILADDAELAIAASKAAYDDSLALFPHGAVAELEDYIIDGEVIAYDPDTDALLPFQRLSTRARKDVTLANITVPVVYAAFDLLYLQGKSLLQVPLEVRRALLKRFFKEVPGKFRFAVGYDTYSGDMDALRGQLDAAVEGHCEGLMVKTLRSNATYEPSKRSLNWLKLKKDYMDGLTDSLDLVVVAAWYGKGKRTGTYGAYLLACYDEEEGEFQCITKVGTGFSDAALASHTKSFNEDLDLVVKEKPRNVNASPNMRQVPDAWFTPRVVWEVKAADLSISPIYTAAIGRVSADKGIALRFPRFLRIREDKSAEQATNAAQVESMYRAQPLAGGSGGGVSVEDGIGEYAE